MSEVDDTLARVSSPPAPITPASLTPASLTPASLTPAPGRAGEYLLGHVLAEGGLGVVHHARHAASGAAAAVKIPHAELAAHPGVVARFAREIQAIRMLRHPNIVQLLDFGWLDDGRPYLAMELLAGISLHAHICARGRLPADEALEILEPMCSALEAAHALGIVHRDIKPSNVFLVEEEGRRRVVLLDFGVAKLLDAPGPALTTSRNLVGTVAYMSPEQLLGKPVEPRSDVYALGALLYTMLTGERPFEAAASPDMRRLLLHHDAPRPSLLAPVHADFDDVVRQAMHSDPAARHASAAAFLAHVRAAAAQDRGASALATAGRRCRALGLYVELLIDPGALEAPEARLLEDIEGVLPVAYEHLEAAGLSLAVETGNGALLVAERPEDAGHDAEVRREVLDAACSLHRRLQGRDSRDPRIHVHLSVHAGEIVANDAGDLVGGDLLELPAWTPDNPTEGVFASAPALAGLEADGGTEPAAAWVRLT